MAENSAITNTKKVLNGGKKFLKVILMPAIIILLIFLVVFIFIIFKKDTSDQTYKDNKKYYDNVIKGTDWGE